MKLLNIDEERIKENYLIIDTLMFSGVTGDYDVKKYVGYIIPHGTSSNRELGIYYADYIWDMNRYEEEGEDYELYQYAKHKKIRNGVIKNGDTFDARIHIFASKLGKDLLRYNYFAEYYFQYRNRVYEFAKHNVLEEGEFNYIDPDIAEYCYEEVQKLIREEKMTLDNAVRTVYITHRDAA